MAEFNDTTYLSQIRSLRGLAVRAAQLFPIQVHKMEFINHGENTTFKVTARGGAKYLLRIHRADYHTPLALKDELRFLESLSRQGLNVPRPVKSKARRSLEFVGHPDVGTRPCDVFHWLDGKFLSKSISESDMRQIGVLLARVQCAGRKTNWRRRKYWHSEGLVGAKPKFGSIDHLPMIRPDEQRKITAARKRILSQLKRYERRHPGKLGLIHADVHFGNLLKTRSGDIALIDFDDCGYGFYMYDLAVTLVGVDYHLALHGRRKQYLRLKKALIEGYSSVAEVTEADLAVLQDLIIARKLLMLGWLHSRSDNPRIRKRVARLARVALKYLARPNL